MRTRHTLQLFSLFLVIFIDTFGYFFVIPAIAILTTSDTGLASQLSASHRELLCSIALMLSPLAFITLSPIAGRWSDRIGRKRTILYCLVASVLGFLIPLIGILTRQLWMVLLGRFLAGAGTTSQPIAQAAITDISKGKAKAFQLGLIGLAMTLAMVLGPLGPRALGTSTVMPYLIASLLSVFNIALLVLTFRETHPPETNTLPFTQRLRLFTPTIVLLLFAFLCGELVWSGYYQAAYLGFLSHEFHTIPAQHDRFIAEVGLWMCIGLTLVYRLWLMIANTRTITLISLLCFGTGFIVLFYSDTLAHHWLIMPMIALTFGTFYPSILDLISNHTPKHSQGWMLGVASQLLGLAWMLTAFVHSYPSTWILGACSALCVITLAALGVSTYTQSNQATDT